MTDSFKHWQKLTKGTPLFPILPNIIPANKGIQVQFLRCLQCKSPELSPLIVIQSELSGKWLDEYRSSCCRNRHGIWKSHTNTRRAWGSQATALCFGSVQGSLPWLGGLQFPESFPVDLLLYCRFSAPGSKTIPLTIFHRAPWDGFTCSEASMEDKLKNLFLMREAVSACSLPYCCALHRTGQHPQDTHGTKPVLRFVLLTGS